LLAPPLLKTVSVSVLLSDHEANKMERDNSTADGHWVSDGAQPITCPQQLVSKQG